MEFLHPTTLHGVFGHYGNAGSAHGLVHFWREAGGGRPGSRPMVVRGGAILVESVVG